MEDSSTGKGATVPIAPASETGGESSGNATSVAKPQSKGKRARSSPPDTRRLHSKVRLSEVEENGEQAGGGAVRMGGKSTRTGMMGSGQEEVGQTDEEEEEESFATGDEETLREEHEIEIENPNEDIADGSRARLAEERKKARVNGRHRMERGNLYATFIAVNGEEEHMKGAFSNKDGYLRRIWIELAEKFPKIYPTISTDGDKLSLNTTEQNEWEEICKLTEIGGVKVVMEQSRAAGNVAIWGRVEGVHTQLTEDELMEDLKNQNVVKVRRVKKPVKLIGSEGVHFEMRNTHYVDILFGETINNMVKIMFREYQVTLLPPEPLQCLKCLQFGHLKRDCAGTELCRRCGNSGHKVMECKARSPTCANCKQAHRSGDDRCPVYQAACKKKRVDYERKIFAKLNAKSVVTRRTQPNIMANPANADTEGKKLYSQVLKRSMVSKTEAGESSALCVLPEVRKVTSQPEKKSEPRPLVAEMPRRDDTTVIALASVVKVILERLAAKFPELVDLLGLLENEIKRYDRQN